MKSKVITHQHEGITISKVKVSQVYRGRSTALWGYQFTIGGVLNTKYTLAEAKTSITTQIKGAK